MIFQFSRIFRPLVLVLIPFVLLIALLVTRNASAMNVFWGEPYTQSNLWLNTTGLNGGAVTDILPSPSVVIGVDADPLSNKVLWAEYLIGSQSQGRILIADTDGTNSSLVTTYPSPGGGTNSIAIDYLSNRVYWNSGSDIVSSDYNGANQTTVLAGVGLVDAMEIDPVFGKIYYTRVDDPAIGFVGGIFSANLNGTGVQPVIANGNSRNILGITVNPIAGELYWSDWGNSTIWQSSILGTATTPYVTGVNVPAGLDYDIFTNRLYFVERAQPGTGKIKWSSGPPGSSVQTIYNGPGELLDVAVIPIPEPSSMVMSALFVTVSSLRFRFR